MIGFVVVTCYKCKEQFGMSNDTHAHLKRSEQSFYCPNGHSQFFPLGPTEAEQLRRERDRLQQRLAEKDDDIAHQRNRAERAERSASAHKGQATKLRKRAQAGVCPCCNRHFAQLARHMATQHPDFQTEPKEELEAAE